MERLIDADVLKEELIKALHEDLMDIDEAIDVVVTTIDDAPTIDPVKHGHWIAHGKSIIGVPVERCSECEEWSCGFNTKYCSKCGAKMDEVKEDEDE